MCDMYDLHCVDSQHLHGKLVGKYLMVNRIKKLRLTYTVGGKWSAEIQMERKMFQVKMGFEFFQPDGSFNINKEKPQEYCWYAKTFL